MIDREFFKALATTKFQEQYGVVIDPNDCSIISIPPAVYYSYGYEVFTDNFTDNIKLRMYLNLNDRIELGNYALEVRNQVDITGTEGEVFVLTGIIDRALKWDNVVTLQRLDIPVENFDAIIDVNSNPILDTNGENILFNPGI